MKTLNSIKLLSLLMVISIASFSCSNDDDSGNQNPEPSMTRLFTSNNSNGNITYYDVTDFSNITTTTLLTTSTAADGIFYDPNGDVVLQASRSGLNLEAFTDISALTTNTAITANIIGSADMQSPRETAVSGNIVVVADNADVDGDTNTPDGRFYVYQSNGTQFTLRNTITVDFKVWGITFIGNDLYAVVDADNELAVFNNFLNNTSNTALSASKRVVVEGIVRTHGLTYDSSNGTMIMTDIGDAANTQDDGGFHVISNFIAKFSAVSNGGTLAVGQQVRVAGSNTLMGNPVDVAYDASTGTVFIAEAGNGGGRILAFNNIGTGGNLSPVVNNSLAAASSVYLSKE
ncbi:hypothetical protein M0G43_11015 [Subsaxibacter sp. CAU 1640]|uniref:hypothetical protein n=1 Tax=Subsaxibacter sp. CAU 1640 TaxID=2933271 RepID=UPI002002E0F8|nr:hypothetical protein [Subsaxibacter sp. CAU 1640]MCK7591106.1 hypothetical protein [Subsaxibacter sp. CAU 1640]